MFDRYKMQINDINEMLQYYSVSKSKWIEIIALKYLRGFTLKDYFTHEFYKYNYYENRKYASIRDGVKFDKKSNNTSQNDILLDKVKTNCFFSDYVKRRWINMKNCNFEDFSDMLAGVNSIIIKENWLCQGDGIRKMQVENNYSLIFSEFAGKDIIIEEDLTYRQHDVLSSIYPSAINTVRVASLYNNGKTTLVAAAIRFGKDGGIIDNLHGGGICAHVDINTGIVVSKAFDGMGKTFILHPNSNNQIIGIKLPYFEEIKRTVVEAANKITAVPWVGWDIAILRDGIELIEGNINQGVDLLQIGGNGLRNILKR